MSEVPAWSRRLRAERTRRGWSQRDLAVQLATAANRPFPEPESVVRRIRDHESGKHRPDDEYAELYCRVYGLSEHAFFGDPADDADLGDEIDAIELARRAAASDVGRETLERLELAVDDLASAYPRTPPAQLLGRVRRHLEYVGRLLDGKKTLTEHRRLLVTGGWLSLLGATCHIDLRQYPAAAARLRTAAQLACHAEHQEIRAWCLETEAWQALTEGEYHHAMVLSRGAQDVAPRSSSAYIQATGQEGRAWARMGKGPETRDALTRIQQLVSPMPMPDRPEHHFRYDPVKSEAYTVTTLSWLRDPAAVQYARQVLYRLESREDGGPRPRRAASARLDLALALLATDEPGEAGHVALQAMTTRLLVPSNYWRAKEVIVGVEQHGIPEADELREVYHELYGTPAEAQRQIGPGF
ncbi:helix-turn-helix domain-containing protein [Nonomuraea endophytica]|uniref:Transcriptional regulator with XRE-family HTH domain n=1 Tax=Nonomuraea endophytica TaxID=714136 RepID=A0A7W8AA62_9ACTN|nr:transcriptional regulator [Nonomuraea endophytica]MBB5082408.1 transcriptional regulator with XRE-family HTH domain [Nonomuraea endophytica]